VTVAADPGNALVVWPTFDADRVVLALVHLLKFARRERLAPWLAAAMARGLPSQACAPASVLVPVPMDRGATRRRGFNQAERIADGLSRQWGLPVARDAIAKTRATPPQWSLGRDERARNLAGAMVPRSKKTVAGRTVVLVDDLVTTGATAAACVSALMAAGAVEVRVVCVGYRP
jgi:ComF family protein